MNPDFAAAGKRAAKKRRKGIDKRQWLWYIVHMVS